MHVRWLAVLIALAASATGRVVVAEEATGAGKRTVAFAEVQTIFAKHCYACHSSDTQESSFRLDNKERAFKGGDLGEKPIVPGQSGDSPLVKYIAGGGDLVMPPKGARLSAEEVGTIKAWIDQGADWPATADGAVKLTTTHWSFQPLKVPPGEHSVDTFIRQKLTAAGLSPSKPADRVTLIRRLYFDILGLPPTPEEIRAFVADKDPLAYEKLVDRALASPRYGERWARHWLDVVRFAETNGFETNVERPNAWHYRDYVIDSLNNDLPYDQFVFQQLAGDAVGADAATGFLVGGPWDQVKSPDPVLTSMQRADELSDITNTTATTFLGLTIGCARCHNHKFDPILQKDYYALQAVFAGVQHGDRAIAKAQSPEMQQKVAELQVELAATKQELDVLQPRGGKRGKITLLDDETLLAGDSSAGSAGVKVLAEKAGHGVNPDGNARGQKADPGDFDHFPNISRGRYTWWKDKPAAEDLFAYYPGVNGKHRVWLSWGSGWQTHTQDAQYYLDKDGDLKTKDDQTLVATIDQQQFAGAKGENVPGQPLWSGFAAIGVQEMTATSAIVLRSGKTGTAITADVIALEELPADAKLLAGESEPAQPPLRLAVSSKENVERFAPVSARFVRFTATATNSGAEPCIDELEIYSIAADAQPARNVALATNNTKLTSSGNYPNNPIHRLEHLNDGKYGNSFSWISNTAGTGWVQIELPETTTIDRIVWGRDRSEQYADRTATQYTIEVATEPGKWRQVATSADRLPVSAGATSPNLAYLDLAPADAAKAKALFTQRKKLEEQLKSLTATQTVYAGVFQRPGDTHRLFRGDPMQPREVVAPDSLTVMGSLNLPASATEQQRRVALAKWIADPANPLTARVMVNRVWQHHFGVGIVDTPSDFGVNGTKPSHPELLDWLAQQFIDGGWSLKKLHRAILLSATYQQSSLPNEAGLKVDAQSRLLWRYPSHRLEAETIRDAILAISGNLDLTMGGPGWSTFKPNSNYVRFYDPKEEFGPAEWRRAIYMTKVRMRQDGVFGTFDCPDAGQIAPKRARSTTALQALSLFNSKFIVQQAEKFAARVEGEGGKSSADKARRSFELAFGRAPDEAELKGATALVDEHGLPALCRALFNANEFLFVP